MRVEQRGSTAVLVDGVGCRPATGAESEMHEEIERLRAKITNLTARLAATYREIGMNEPEGGE